MPAERLQRPDQDTGSHAHGLAGNVQHVRCAIGEIDIGVAAREKERVGPGRLAAIGVTGGIADRIGLGLDDAPAEDVPRASARTTILPIRYRASSTVSSGSFDRAST